MKNNSNDMYTNGSYLQQNPGWHEQDAAWKADIIYKLLKKNNVPIQTIIEVGCGAGGILEQLFLTDGSIQSLKGFDISPQAIAIARRKENDRLSFKNIDFFSTNERADLILVVDVLEHVDDFYDFLRQLRERAHFFIFHIPLDLCFRSLIKPHILLQQREAVGHIHYFSRQMVEWFLYDTGYQIIDWEYTKPVVDTDPPDSLKRSVKKVFRNLSFAIHKKMSATLWGGYSMMILAK